MSTHAGTPESLPEGHPPRQQEPMPPGPGKSKKRGLIWVLFLLIIVGVALFFFGPTRLPELGKGLAEGIRNFKSGLKDGESDAEKK